MKKGGGAGGEGIQISANALYLKLHSGNGFVVDTFAIEKWQICFPLYGSSGSVWARTVQDEYLGATSDKGKRQAHFLRPPPRHTNTQHKHKMKRVMPYGSNFMYSQAAGTLSIASIIIDTTCVEPIAPARRW